MPKYASDSDDEASAMPAKLFRRQEANACSSGRRQSCGCIALEGQDSVRCTDGWKLPQIPEIVLHEHTFREAATVFHRRFNQALAILLDIACGRDPGLFILAIVFLYILSVVGTCFSFLNFLYLGYVGLQTVPILYERYEAEVDYIAGTLMRDMRRAYRKFDSRVLNKIPGDPVKEKKAR
ncbi:unnamed protein product [Linum trigynum]|uniref:Reticulon-like protein n=1 Tax=Linum trigynum TaxID=586398 RepID=A0AAV2EZT6_9ROSI